MTDLINDLTNKTVEIFKFVLLHDQSKTESIKKVLKKSLCEITEKANDIAINKLIEDLDPIDNNTTTDIFKKIILLFKGLSDLLKILLLQINNENYQLAASEKIKFPDNIETLIIVMGTFDEAFDENVMRMLFNIIDFPEYNELYTISKINYLLIPFVANGDIKKDCLVADFNKFCVLVKSFVRYALNLNDDLEQYNNIIETIEM
jgi:hypothetical protein